MTKRQRRQDRLHSLRAAAAATDHLTLTGGAVNFIEAAAAAEGEAPKLPRFEILGYTGAPMRVGFYSYPVVVDLASMTAPNATCPILKDHDQRQVVGHADTIDIGQTLTLSGIISGTGAAAKEIVANAKNGFPWQASLGASVGEMTFIEGGKTGTANGKTIKGPVYLAKNTVLGEVSFVAAGADPKTAATVAAAIAAAQSQEMHPMTFDKWLTAKGFDATDLDETQTATMRAMYDAEIAASAGTPAPTPATTATPATPDPQVTAAAEPDIAATMREQAAAETERIAAIQTICAGSHADIEAQAIRENWDVNRTEVSVLRAERPTAPNIGSGRPAPSADSLTAAMSLAAGLPEAGLLADFGEPTMEAAAPMRRMSLPRLMERCITLEGQQPPSDFCNDTIRAAFSTISLPGILGNVANRTMLESFNAFQAVLPQIASETDVNDFKTHTRYRLTMNGTFQKVGADGELKSATLGEESFTQRLDTWGMVLSLTRQMIFNDDLGAFLQIPRMIGRKANLAREKAGFTLLLSNPSDFFHANNDNFAAGSDTPLAIGSLSTAEQKFYDQTDANGDPIGALPEILLVPSSLKVTAEQLYASLKLNETTTANKAKPSDNPHAGKFRPLASPFLNNANLTGYSALAWYMFANPADLAAMEIAYLRGQRTPTIEKGDTDFTNLGMYWRGYWDFGVAMQDSRAAVKMLGTTE